MFFFSDGVHNASSLAITPQDEPSIQMQWDKLIKQYDLDAVACVSSAIKRGIINAQEANRYDLESVSINDSSEIAGLGQLVDAVLLSDRTVNFG